MLKYLLIQRLDENIPEIFKIKTFSGKCGLHPAFEIKIIYG